MGFGISRHCRVAGAPPHIIEHRLLFRARLQRIPGFLQEHDGSMAAANTGGEDSTEMLARLTALFQESAGQLFPNVWQRCSPAADLEICLAHLDGYLEGNNAAMPAKRMGSSRVATASVRFKDAQQMQLIIPRAAPLRAGEPASCPIHLVQAKPLVSQETKPLPEQASHTYRMERARCGPGLAEQGLSRSHNALCAAVNILAFLWFHPPK
jgi:hypothetical protein